MPGRDDDKRSSAFSSTLFKPETESYLLASGAERDRRDPEGLALPTVVGYVIKRRIGAGGMGVVFEAEQESPRRPVALKVLRQSSLGDALRLRLFRREVETLGMLEHPGIASIYAAGQTTDGHPFFAMELVHGQPLGQYCWETLDARGRRAVQERLRLFQQVVDAISYAHQRGVIHRDLKPDNILVTGGVDGSDAQVKILDFGLARITDADLARVSVHTEIGIIQGTLGYMSPEQSRGNTRDLDLRTDVYALGVILYELLAGRLPHALEGAPIHQAVRILNEEQPATLSQVWRDWKRETDDPKRRQRSRPPLKVSRDLETIVLKAIEKEPDRRYQSAIELGADIGRLLANQPILARPTTPIYRLSRWVQRNPALSLAAVLGAALFTVLLDASASLAVILFVAGPILFAITQKRAKDLLQEERDETLRQRDLAEAHARVAEAAQRAAEREAERASYEAETSQQVISFLTELFELSDPHQGDGEEIRVADVLDRGAEQVLGRLADRPRVQSRLLRTIGRVYNSLGLYQRSLPLAGRALECVRGLHGDDHPETATALQDLATSLSNSGQWREAKTLFEQSLELRRRHLLPDDPALAESMTSLAVVEHKLGQLERARALAEEGYAILQRSETESELVGSTLAFLGTVARDSGDLEEAERYFRASVTMRQQLGSSQFVVAEGLNGLATLLLAQERHEEAEAGFRDALELRIGLLGDCDPRVAETMNNLAATLMQLEHMGEAEDLYRQSIEIKRQLFGDEDERIAVSYLNLATLLLSCERCHEAEDLFRCALGIFEACLDPDHWKVGASRCSLANCLALQDRFEEAEALFRSGFSLVEATFGPLHDRTRKTRAKLATMYDRWGKPDLARQYQDAPAIPDTAGPGSDRP